MLCYDGQVVLERTLRNGPLEVKILDWGATITSVRTPDKSGVVGEITLGFNDLKPYVDGRSPFFGCVAGRVANRTANGRFTIDGKTYKLAKNNGANHLHGGRVGFDKKLWFCEAQTETSATFLLVSPAGDEGYPGCLLARVTYSLPTPTTLRIEYTAHTDAPTPVNLTNHAYWNLKDGGASDVLNHQIELAADFYLPVNAGSIPTGEVRPVSAAPAMDLRGPRAIGEKIAKADQGMGYDHNWVLRRPGNDGMRDVARVWEPTSGRWMRVSTDQPGVQFYTANYLDGSLRRAAGGGAFCKHHGFCLETQLFPDSANCPHFPGRVFLRPGEQYTHTTEHQFGVSVTSPA